MRTAMSGGGFTVAGGTPLMCSIGQSRVVTAMLCAIQPVAGCLILTISGPFSSRPTPNTKSPSGATDSVCPAY